MASEAAGLNLYFTCHQFRHTLNNRLRAKGVDYATVQAIMGHSGDEMTIHYSHVGAAEKYSALLRLEAA